MKPLVSMRQAVTDQRLFGFMLPGPTFLPQRTLLIGSMGEEMTDEEAAIWRTITGREPLTERATEMSWIMGRRSGKTLSAACWSVYQTFLVEYDLSPGEEAISLFAAQTARNAQVAFGYAKAIVERSPVIGKLVDQVLSDTIKLKNGTALEIRPASFRNLRGFTMLSAVLDEVAFFHLEEAGSRNSDQEIVAAIRPALSTVEGGLLKVSSPYAQSGELWNDWSRHGFKEGAPVVVAKAASRTMNSKLKQSIVDAALEADRPKAEAEYLAIFRSDVTGFVSMEMIAPLIDKWIMVRPPMPGIRYSAFYDGSGGRRDSACLAIAHQSKDRKIILDCVIERKSPHDPEQAIEEFAATLKEYGVHAVTGDNYSAAWSANSWSKNGITFHLSKLDRSTIYLSTLPLITSARISFLDHDRLIGQLVNLERRTGQGGKDKVDHVKHGHDDLINAVAGAIVNLALKRTFREPGAGMPEVIYLDGPPSRQKPDFSGIPDEVFRVPKRRSF